jgi:hypothetical protein
VSKASDDLPEPEGPVKTTNFFFGIESETFLRLCWRAPVMTIESGSKKPSGEKERREGEIIANIERRPDTGLPEGRARASGCDQRS